MNLDRRLFATSSFLAMPLVVLLLVGTSACGGRAGDSFSEGWSFAGIALTAIGFAIDDDEAAPPPPPPAPNFQIASLRATGGAQIGSTYTVSVNVRNAGALATSQSRVKFLLYTGEVGYPLETMEIGMIAAGSSINVSIVSTATENGRLVLGACVDTVTGELNASDNCASGAARVSLVVGEDAPNLDMRRVNSEIRRVNQHFEYTFNIRAHNAGTQAANASRLTWRLRIGAAPTSTVLVEPVRPLTALAFQSFAYSTVLTTAGEYRFLACVDQVAGEIQTTDNCLPSGGFLAIVCPVGLAVDSNDICGIDANLDGRADRPGTDLDGDKMADAVDVDDDNNGLIDIYNVDMLYNMRHQPRGDVYQASTYVSSVTIIGAPTAATVNCLTPTALGVFLCGYELKGSLDFNSNQSYEQGSQLLINKNFLPLDRETPSRDGRSVSPANAVNRGWEAIDLESIFDGNGYSITNLYARALPNAAGSSAAQLGLFGELSSAATIRSLKIGRGNLFGSTGNDLIGAVAAIHRGAARFVSVESVFINGGGGNDTQGAIIGQLAGSSGSLDQAVAVDVEIQGGAGQDKVGGLLGSAEQGSLANSFASLISLQGGTGDGDQVGGLIGEASSATVRNVYVSGAGVFGGLGDNDSLAGLAGVGVNTMPVRSYQHLITRSAGESSGLDATILSSSHMTTCTQSGFAVDGNGDITGLNVGMPQCGASSSDFVGWNTRVWNFGLLDAFPILSSSSLSVDAQNAWLYAAALDIQFSEGQNASSITSSFSLPAVIGSAASVTWSEVQDSALAAQISGNTVSVVRAAPGSPDSPVILRATVNFGSVNVTRDFMLVVLAQT